jgi:hypothetical protein
LQVYRAEEVEVEERREVEIVFMTLELSCNDYRY